MRRVLAYSHSLSEGQPIDRGRVDAYVKEILRVKESQPGVYDGIIQGLETGLSKDNLGLTTDEATEVLSLLKSNDRLPTSQIDASVANRQRVAHELNSLPENHNAHGQSQVNIPRLIAAELKKLKRFKNEN